MSNKADEVHINFDQNPAVAEALRDTKPGDKGEMEFKYTYKEGDQTSCVLIVEAFIPEGYEVAKGDDRMDMNPTNTGGDAMTPTAMMVRKKSNKKTDGGEPKLPGPTSGNY